MMFYYMVVLVILFLLNFLLFPQLLKPDVKEVDYGTFLSMVDKKEVSKVQIEDDMIYFQDKEETPNYYETAAFEDPDLVERLYDAGCSFDRVVQKEMSPLLSFLLTWILPILIFAGLGELLGRSMMKRMGGGSGAMQFGKSNAKIYVQSETGIKFGDVAGEDEAKETLTGDRGFPAQPGEIPCHRGVHAKGSASCGTSGYRKNAACKGGCRRSRCAVFLHFRFGIRRNVCRYGRVQSA